MTSSPSTWVLVADARAARIFTFADNARSTWNLHETIKGDGSGSPAQTADFGAKASEHKGALRGHAEGTPKEDDERKFAHTLAHVLERGHAAKEFTKLVLALPPKLLGDLRENLNHGLKGAVIFETPKDYTHQTVAELIKVLGAELPV